ncbi:dihydrofolate synthase [Vibrio cholerae]|nr:dihydrofolate synthase [Vibrio cholerae]
MYSSPHLIRYNERVRINGQDLAAAESRCVAA